MFEDDESGEAEKFRNYKTTPVYQKAVYICDLARRIAEIAEKGAAEQTKEYQREVWKDYASWLRTDSSIIPAKIAGAYGADLYDIQMQNAAIIRKSAMDVILHLRGLQMHGFKDTEYLDIIRNEMEEFRVLFAEWVKTFDPWNYIIDRWGLFNPPGVSYDDIDPDDDIPFENPFDDFDEDDLDDLFGDMDDED